MAERPEPPEAIMAVAVRPVPVDKLPVYMQKAEQLGIKVTVIVDEQGNPPETYIDADPLTGRPMDTPMPLGSHLLAFSGFGDVIITRYLQEVSLSTA